MSESEHDRGFSSSRRHQGVSIQVTDSPAGLSRSLKIPQAEVDKVWRETIRPAINVSPYVFQIKINLPSSVLELRWQRVGSLAGYVLWHWNKEIVAATLVLDGVHDVDDCTAVDVLRRLFGRRIPVDFFKRVCETERPMFGTAFMQTVPAINVVIATFAAAISTSLCEQGIVKESHKPLGPAMPRDFPARFCHMIVSNGLVQRRMWPTAKPFLAEPDLREVVATFTDRLDDSPTGFDELLVMRGNNVTVPFRVQWQGPSTAAGIARLTDGRNITHTLLLLSGKDAAVERAVIDELSSESGGTPSNFNATVWQITTAPRPLLVWMTMSAAEQIMPAAIR